MTHRPPTLLRLLNSKLFLLFLPLLVALAYLPQLTTRDLRLEEGRRAQPAAEMLASGNWITPTIYSEPYLNKPPLFFWIAAALGKLQGHVTTLSIRLPSVLSALLGAYLLLAFAPRQLSRHTRALAALIFLSMPIMLDKGTLGEIDALLSLLTFASFTALWNFYNPATGKIALTGWLLSGLAMALAALLKGPGGPIEFYAIFIPFLLLAKRGRWKLLFSPGHFLMVAIAITPVLIWMSLLISRSNLHADSVAYQWADQLGLRSLLGTPSAFPGQKEPSQIPWKHYAYFPLEVISMLLPWSLLAILPTFPKFARKVGWLPTGTNPAQHNLPVPLSPSPPLIPPDLYLLLAVSAPALLAVFWLYPMAFARHLMMIAYPVSLLVALTFTTSRSLPPWPDLRPFLRSAAAILALALAFLSVAAIPFALKFSPRTLFTTCLIAFCVFHLAFAAYKLTVRAPLHHAPLAFACNLALIVTLGYGLAISIFNPAKAPTDESRLVHHQITALIPQNLPIYTTRTLLSGKGNNYFNIQFYFPRIPRAIDHFSDLPPNQTVILILAPEESAPLVALFPNTKILGILQPKKATTPPLFVAQVTVPPKQPHIPPGLPGVTHPNGNNAIE